MATPNPLEPVKGAGTTLWVYNGKGDAYANPLSDDDWQRLAKACPVYTYDAADDQIGVGPGGYRTRYTTHNK
ncbi:phage tail tube protein, partial [Escherichia coli]|uniref:phage tail tube protein n=1 Tax=Escherichia coli TaxID=562 RepID=UPI0025A147EC